MLMSHIRSKTRMVQPICNQYSIPCLLIRKKPGPGITRSRLKNGDRKSSAEMTLTPQWEMSHSPPSVHLIPISIHLSQPFRSYCRTIYKPGYAKWDNVFAVLEDGDVELDTFSKKMKPKELMQLCGSHMKEATAKRLIEAFKSWRKASKTA